MYSGRLFLWAFFWMWPVIIHHDGGATGNQVWTPEAPESWHSENTTRVDHVRTESKYATAYSDCNLQMSKDGTRTVTDRISFLLHLECSGEQGIPSTYGNATNRFHYMTVPSDFAASWHDYTFCEMTLTRYDNHAGNYTSTSAYVDISCRERR